MCDYGADDDTEVWVYEWIRARKPRPCCACSREIVRGQIYHRYKALRDGAWEKWDHCATCWRICESIWARNNGDAIDLELSCGELWDENFGADPEVGVLAFELPVEAQRRAEVAYADAYQRRHTAP